MKEILNSIFVRALGWLRRLVSKRCENAFMNWGDILIKIKGLNGRNGLAGFVYGYNSVIAGIYRRKTTIYMYIIDALREMESKIKNE